MNSVFFWNYKPEFWMRGKHQFFTRRHLFANQFIFHNYTLFCSNFVNFITVNQKIARQSVLFRLTSFPPSLHPDSLFPQPSDFSYWMKSLFPALTDFGYHSMFHSLTRCFTSLTSLHFPTDVIKLVCAPIHIAPFIPLFSLSFFLLSTPGQRLYQCAFISKRYTSFSRNW